MLLEPRSHVPFADAPEVPPFDLVFKVRLCESHAHEANEKAMYCFRKRQLSRAELRRRGLVNSATPSGIHAMLGADTIERMKRSNGNPVRGRLEVSIICFQASLECKEDVQAFWFTQTCVRA